MFALSPLVLGWPPFPLSLSSCPSHPLFVRCSATLLGSSLVPKPPLTFSINPPSPPLLQCASLRFPLLQYLPPMLQCSLPHSSFCSSPPLTLVFVPQHPLLLYFSSTLLASVFAHLALFLLSSIFPPHFPLGSLFVPSTPLASMFSRNSGDRVGVPR